jgi:hypothetical protein
MQTKNKEKKKGREGGRKRGREEGREGSTASSRPKWLNCLRKQVYCAIGITSPCDYHILLHTNRKTSENGVPYSSLLTEDSNRTQFNILRYCQRLIKYTQAHNQ